MKYLSAKRYGSIWDVSCNVGFMLASLLKKHPGAKHYGTDISNVMVETTRKNCPSCIAAQFDLGNLRHPGISPQDAVHAAWHREDVPRFFDVILVSDVLPFCMRACQQHLSICFAACCCFTCLIRACRQDDVQQFHSGTLDSKARSQWP